MAAQKLKWHDPDEWPIEPPFTVGDVIVMVACEFINLLLTPFKPRPV